MTKWPGGKYKERDKKVNCKRKKGRKKERKKK